MHTNLFCLSFSVKLRWQVHMDIINSYYISIFTIFLLLYCTKVTGFSLTIMWSVPPNAEKINHQKLPLVRRLLHVEFHRLWCLISMCLIIRLLIKPEHSKLWNLPIILFLNSPKLVYYSPSFYLLFSHYAKQWSLNNPVTNGPVVIGCNKEVAVLQMTSIKRSHPFLPQMAIIIEYNVEYVL